MSDIPQTGTFGRIMLAVVTFGIHPFVVARRADAKIADLERRLAKLEAAT